MPRTPDRRLSNLDLVDLCDNFPYLASNPSDQNLYTLYLPNDDRPHGYVTAQNIQLFQWPAQFHVSHQTRRVTLLPSSGDSKSSSSSSSAAIARLVDAAIDSEKFHRLRGGHSEFYRVPGAREAVVVERFAAPLLGITTRGAHMTIFSRGSGPSSHSGRNVDLRIWVARRSRRIYSFPGFLDTTVAGGVPAHESPLQTLIHEAQEEAGIAALVIRSRARATGLLTYLHSEPGGIGKDSWVGGDCVYCYDLEVDQENEEKGFRLVPVDGEVEEFISMGADEVCEALANGAFKPNSALVMLDFLIRHGVVTQENEPDYAEIVARMHRRLPFPVVTPAEVVYDSPEG